MANKKSKTKRGEYEWSSDVHRIIPLQNNYCYVNNEKGKTLHLKRDSEDFYNLIFKLDEIMNGKIRRELESLSWTEQLNTLEMMQTEKTSGDE